MLPSLILDGPVILYVLGAGGGDGEVLVSLICILVDIPNAGTLQINASAPSVVSSFLAVIVTLPIPPLITNCPPMP